MQKLRNAEFDCSSGGIQSSRRDNVIEMHKEVYSGKLPELFSKELVETGVYFGSQNPEFKTKDEYCNFREPKVRSFFEVLNILLNNTDAELKKG